MLNKIDMYCQVPQLVPHSDLDAIGVWRKGWGGAAYNGLARLFSNGVRVAREIGTLIEHGYPHGAPARWRTLHETGRRRPVHPDQPARDRGTVHGTCPHTTVSGDDAREDPSRRGTVEPCRPASPTNTEVAPGARRASRHERPGVQERPNLGRAGGRGKRMPADARLSRRRVRRSADPLELLFSAQPQTFPVRLAFIQDLQHALPGCGRALVQ